MKQKKWKIYVLFIAATLAVGGLSSLISNAGMEAYDAAAKPPLTPPDAVFPIVWAILYTLMGIGAARVYLAGTTGSKPAIRLYIAQLAVNFFWSILYFNLHAYLAAFLWLLLLWVLILLMIRAFMKIDKLAGRLQIPYLLWVTFAGYLNFGVWLLNR